MTKTKVHPTALVSPRAELGANVEVGPFTIIHDDVIIGENSVIGSHCEIGLPTGLANSPELRIGADATIRSHSVVYAGSQIGPGLKTGHHVGIRENSVIGTSFQLGSRGDVQGDCQIGDFVRTHSDVHIGKTSRVGNCVWLYPEVLLTNDPTPPSEDLIGVEIGDFAIVASKVLLLPGAVIEPDCLIAAGSVVGGRVPEGKVARGNPAKIICDAAILRLHSDPSVKAYPWRKRFHRGYPEHLVQQWLGQVAAAVG